MAALVQNFADATLIYAERLRNVILSFAKEMPLPDLDGVVERHPRSGSAESGPRVAIEVVHS